MKLNQPSAPTDGKLNTLMASSFLRDVCVYV